MEGHLRSEPTATTTISKRTEVVQLLGPERRASHNEAVDAELLQLSQRLVSMPAPRPQRLQTWNCCSGHRFSAAAHDALGLCGC